MHINRLVRSLRPSNTTVCVAALLSTWAVAAPCPKALAQTPSFTFMEKQGPHLVGLRVVNQYDYSRTFLPTLDDLGRPYKGERARPLQTLVWYPAEKTNARPITFGDYVALQATETSFENPKILTGGDERLIGGMTPALAHAMWAVRDAPASPGRFPVVIYAPSFSSVSWENADLCEYLASYGYVVIAGPAMGVGRESTHDVAGTTAQARDISFFIAFAHGLPDADTSAVGAVGFSWGALASLFAAARDNAIDALVALDGSIRYYPWVVKQAGDVHPEEMTIPLLFFKGQSSLEDEARIQDSYKADGPNVLNAWTHGDLLSIEMLGLIHPEFVSLGQRNEGLWEKEFLKLQSGDYDRHDGEVGYGWVARYTREFLDAYLKHQAPARSFLERTPAENGVPRHVMGMRFAKAAPMPTSFAAFREAVAVRGFDRAVETYEDMHKKYPDFTLDPTAVTAWAYRLLADRQFAEAIGVMLLGTWLDPSSSAYTSLGEMYLKAGRTRLAAESYTVALTKDPQNTVAKESLEKLKGTTSPSPK